MGRNIWRDAHSLPIIPILQLLSKAPFRKYGLHQTVPARENISATIASRPLSLHCPSIFFPLSFFFLFFSLPDFYNFLLVGAAALTQTKLHFLVIGPHGM